MPINHEEIWARVKANSANLEACAGHNFSIDLTPEATINKRWRCSICNGEVDSINKYWYEAGRRHESAQSADQAKPQVLSSRACVEYGCTKEANEGSNYCETHQPYKNPRFTGKRH